MLHARHVGRCGIVPQKKHNRVARGEVHQHKNKKGNSEKNRHCANNPSSERVHL
jgi:hypothetical protein